MKPHLEKRISDQPTKHDISHAQSICQIFIKKEFATIQQRINNCEYRSQIEFERDVKLFYQFLLEHGPKTVLKQQVYQDFYQMVLKEGITIKDKLRDLDKVNIESRICYLKEKQFDSQKEKYENMIEIMQKQNKELNDRLQIQIDNSQNSLRDQHLFIQLKHKIQKLNAILTRKDQELCEMKSLYDNQLRDKQEQYLQLKQNQEKANALLQQENTFLQMQLDDAKQKQILQKRSHDQMVLALKQSKETCTIKDNQEIQLLEIQFEQQKKQLKDQIEQLKIWNEEDTKRQAQRYESQIDELKQTITQQQNYIDLLDTSQRNEFQQEVSTLRQQMYENEHQYESQLQQFKSQLQQDDIFSIQKIQSYESEIKNLQITLKEEIEKKDQKIQEDQEKIINLTHKIEKLKKKLSKKEEGLNMLQIQDFDDHNRHELETSLAYANQQNEYLKDKLKQLQVKIEQIITKYESEMKQQLDEQLYKFNSIQQQLEQSQKEISRLQAQLSQIKQSKSELKAENVAKLKEALDERCYVPRMTPELEKIKQDLLDLEAEKHELKGNYEKDQVLWQKKFTFLTEQKDQARDDLQEASKNFELALEALQQRKTLEKEDEGKAVTYLEQRIFDLENNLQIQEEESDKKYYHLLEQNQTLQMEIKTKDTQITQLKQQIEELESQIQQQERKKQAIYFESEKERSKWAMEREWLIQQKKDIEERLNNQERKKENLLREIDKLKEDNQRKSRNSIRRSPMRELNSVERSEQSFESYYQMHSLK